MIMRLTRALSSHNCAYLIADFLRVSISHGERLQLVRYSPGGYYKPHYDYFSDTAGLVRGGQRTWTVLS